MPPLSFLDQFIYWTVFLVLCVLNFALLFGPFCLREQIAFADEIVIAKEDNASMFWLIVPWMTFFLMTFILWLKPYQNRRPIFGRRNFKYGPPAWPKIYPLFMRNKPYVFVSDRAKKDRKTAAFILLVVLLISFIPFPWALYGRDCLCSDGSIVQYSMFNGKTREFSSGQIDSVEIETYRSSTGKYIRREYWGVRLTLTTDSGKVYSFEQSEFRGSKQAEAPYWLTAMLRVKNRYDPGIITYSGLEHLEDVISDKGLLADEAELLYQLFGLT